MNLFDTTQTLLERALIGSSQRQAALAENLANVNTPGFQRRDVDFHGVLAQAIQRRDARGVEHAAFRTEVQPGAVRADGNGVDPDAEAAALARNGLEYEAFVSVARARIDILKSAMGVG